MSGTKAGAHKRLKPGRKGKQYKRVVNWFAEQMRAQLVANRLKGGWGEGMCSETFLKDKLQEEVKELYEALASGWPRDQGQIAWIVKEAADVANMALMLADRASGQH